MEEKVARERGYRSGVRGKPACSAVLETDIGECRTGASDSVKLCGMSENRDVEVTADLSKVGIINNTRERSHWITGSRKLSGGGVRKAWET